jgi:hypothetical protein
MSSQEFPELRQVVLLTSDLEGALDRAREYFKVPSGFRDVEGMAAIGFSHEVFGFDRTYVEICEPLDPQSRVGQKAAQADSGFMVVIQVDDRDAMVERASSLGVQPLFVKDHHGSPISQWHPRDFGTIAEIDEMRPPTSWHFAPDVYATRSTSVVEDIVTIYLSVAEPQAMAARWAEVIGGECVGDAVRVGSRWLRFAQVDGISNVYQVDCRASDRNRVGETFELCGVRFCLV